MAKLDARITDEQKAFARAISNGTPLYDAYVLAYMNGETPERTASNYTKKQIQNRASMMKKSKGVRTLLAKEIIDADIKNAGMVVWDRQKATNALMKAQQRAESYLDTLEQATQSLKDKGADFYKIYAFGIDMLGKVSDTLLKVAQELNKMYGLGTPEIVNNNAIQVIFGAPDTLPPDKDLEGFEDEEQES